MTEFVFPVSNVQIELERRFFEAVDVHRAYEWTVEMCKVGAKGVNQLMGTPENARKAKYIASRLRECGLQVEIQRFQCERHDVLERSLTVTAPQKAEVQCAPMILGDPTPPEGVSGELLHVGKGWEEDYKKLQKKGVDARGKIVLIDGLWARSRLIIARIHGAVGAIVTTRLDYDYYEGPSGGWHRPINILPRGSTGAWLEHQLEYAFYKIPAESLPLIPAISVQKKDGEYLRGLCRKGGVKVLLKVAKKIERRPTYNVIATITGSELPNEVVMIGAHHDSFGRGVLDDSSGCGVVLAAARTFANLVKEGFRPRRTLKFCFWTGEEEGDFGSYAYWNDHGSLRNKIVTYVDVDGGVFGKDVVQGGWGSPEFKILSRYVATAVVPPVESGGYTVVGGSGFDMIVFFIDGGIPVTTPAVMRSGKDWIGNKLTPYLVKENPYHGPADEPEPEMLLKPERFKEPIEGVGVMLLTLTESEVLPLDYTNYVQMLMEDIKGLINFEEDASSLGVDLQGAMKELDRMREESEKMNRVLASVVSAYLKATGQGPWEECLDLELSRRVDRFPRSLPKKTLDAMRRYFRMANLIRRLAITRDLRATCFNSDGADLIHLPWVQPLKYADVLRRDPEILERVRAEARMLEYTFRGLNMTMADLSSRGEELIPKT